MARARQADSTAYSRPFDDDERTGVTTATGVTMFEDMEAGLRQLGQVYGAERVYGTFRRIYKACPDDGPVGRSEQALDVTATVLRRTNRR